MFDILAISSVSPERTDCIRGISAAYSSTFDISLILQAKIVIITLTGKELMKIMYF